jgi:hypothetical protein
VAHRLAIGFVVDTVKDKDRLLEEFINSGVYLRDRHCLVGDVLRVIGIRIVEFPTLDVYTEKLYNLSDNDFENLGLGILSNVKDCYMYCFWDTYNYFVNFVIRDYSSKKLSIANEKFISIAFAELENGNLLFSCGEVEHKTKYTGKVYLGDNNLDFSKKFSPFDLVNSYSATNINEPILTELIGEDYLRFYYSFDKGFYLALGDCIVWTNIVGDSTVYKGNILCQFFHRHITDYDLDLFEELGCLFNITENLINIDDVSIQCLDEENKELILPYECKYFVCSNREYCLSDYSNIIFSPNISSIVFDCYDIDLVDLGKQGDKKKYSNCTFYFKEDTSVIFFIDVLFNQFLTSYIYKKYEKEKTIECFTDFRKVMLFGKSFRTTMTEEEFEVSKSNLLKGVETAKDFIEHFKNILPVKIKLY